MSKVIRIKKSYSKANFRRNGKSTRFRNISSEKYKIVLLLVSIISILIGSLLYNRYNSSPIIEIISNTINVFQAGNYLEIFISTLKSEIIFFLIALLLGTSFIGTPLSVIPISLRCVLTGFIGAYMYNEFELKGVLFCLLFIFPYTAIATTSLLFASNESIYMSNKSFNTITNKNTADDISVKLYLLRYLILIVINVVAAIFNSLLIVTLINKINL